MKKLIVLFILFQCSSGVIYRLNAIDYYRMPPVYFLDDYISCIEKSDNLYCGIEADLVSDTPSKVLAMIQEFSLHTATHFNHSHIFRGVCVKETCSKFYNQTLNIRQTLESCLNESLWMDYKLKGKISGELICNTIHSYSDKDALDITVAFVIIIILMVNIVRSFYDFYSRKDDKTGYKYILFFSIQRNWRRLTASFAIGPEPRFERLRSFNGVRMASMVLVICAHSSIPCMTYIDNTRFVEKMYDLNAMHVFFNGNLIVRSYFITSVFMLIYNLLIISETHELKWTHIPIGILHRIIRLTPTYALVLAWCMTWERFLGDGPGWDIAVLTEIKHCRRDWWKHLLFINNYFDESHCNIPTWYLAADMQMYCLALIVFLCCRTIRDKKIAICVMFVLGVMIPAITIYLLDIEPLPITSPTAIHEYFTTDKTFNNIYKRGHAHVISVAFGMALAMIVYHCQQTNFDVNKYKKYRYLVWISPAISYMLLMLTFPFYADGPRVSVVIRILFSCFIVPSMHLILTFVFWSFMVKLEDIYRGIMEWHGWTVPGRATYCAFLIHAVLIRVIAGSQTSLVHSSFVHILQFTMLIIITSYGIAFMLFILVESPFNQLLRLSRPLQGSQKPEDKNLRNITVLVEANKEDLDPKNIENTSTL